MRIVHIATVPQTLAYFLCGHIQHAKSQGAEIHVICSPGPELDRFAASQAVEAHGVVMHRRISPWQDAGAAIDMARRLRRIRPAIVHAHTPKGGLLGMLAATAARVPVRIYHIHGLPQMTARGGKRALLQNCDRIACALAHQTFCVSPSLRDIVVAQKICPANHVAVLENGSICGVDADIRFNPRRGGAAARTRIRRQFRIGDGDRVVGFVGRLVRDKGLTELTEAWRRLRDEFPNLHLLMVGPVEPHDPIPEDDWRTLRCDPRVHVAGLVEETAAYYAAMDILAFPTYREGFGQAAVEASAMGLPVVATGVPGCLDAVHDGVSGTLVPPRDAPALSAAIRRYLWDPRLRRRHGDQGRRRVCQLYRPQALWRALWAEYERLMIGARLATTDLSPPPPAQRKRAA